MAARVTVRRQGTGRPTARRQVGGRTGANVTKPAARRQVGGRTRTTGRTASVPKAGAGVRKAVRRSVTGKGGNALSIQRAVNRQLGKTKKR